MVSLKRGFLEFDNEYRGHTMESKFKLFFLRLFALLTIFFALSVYSQRSNFKSFKEMETEKQIESERKAGFADIEIDNLHESISQSIQGIKRMVDLGVDRQAAIYLPEIPATEVDIFKLDKEGKTYIEVNLPQGQSFVDWPRVYIYNGIGFIYPSEDFSKLDKIIFMFRRVNADGFVYIKEMRRLINPSPNFSVRREDGTSEIDSNSDIILEYYQSFSSNTIWPDLPHQPFEPNVVMVLNKEDAPLPYEKQKLIMNQYKKILRTINRDLALKLRGLELDQRRMITKMLDFR